MKTHKHGNGMTHYQVVAFSNRLAYAGTHKEGDQKSRYLTGFYEGWEACALYFAHKLRVELRECEQLNEI